METGVVCVCILSGIPGSGKSTICTELTKRLQYQWVHVCYDSLLNWMELEDRTWKNARNQVFSFVELLVETIQQGCLTKSVLPVHKLKTDYQNLQSEAIFHLLNTVGSLDTTTDKCIVFLIDDTMHYRSMRQQYHHLARKLRIGYCVIQTKCDLTSCLERNSLRSNTLVVLNKSIIQIHAQLEDAGHCSWEKDCTYVIDTSTFINETSYFKMLNLIETVLYNPLSTTPMPNADYIEQSKVANQRNVIHQADIILRQLVGDKIKDLKEKQNSGIPVFTAEVACVKGKILLSFKQDVDLTIFVESETQLVDINLLKQKLKLLFDAYFTEFSKPF